MEWIQASTYLFIIFLGISLLFFYRVIMQQAALRKKIEESWPQKQQVFPKWKVRLVQTVVEWAKGFIPIGERITYFSSDQDLDKHLLKAGRPYNLHVRDIHGLKILLAFIGFIAGFLAMFILFFLGPATLVLFPMIGYFLPIWWLKRAGKRRQILISKELPDFLDTVSITLSAGLGLDGALERYVKSISTPLSEEISLYIDEVRLGVTREQALFNLARRTDNLDIENLVNDLVQALRLGVPFARTFRLQAEGMRTIREERAKTQAEKAGPKMAMVISLVITPSILVFIIGVLIISFSGG